MATLTDFNSDDFRPAAICTRQELRATLIALAEGKSIGAFYVDMTDGFSADSCSEIRNRLWPLVEHK